MKFYSVQEMLRTIKKFIDYSKEENINLYIEFEGSVFANFMNDLEELKEEAKRAKQIPSAGVYGKTGFPGSSGPEAAEDFALTSGLLAAYRLPVLVKDVKSYVSKQISELK